MWYDGNNAIAELGVYFTPKKYNFDKTNVNGFIANVKERNLLPFDRLNVYYYDDYWDFSGFQATNTNISYYRFDFTKSPECFKEDLKNFVLISVIENRKKIGGIYENFRVMNKFLSFCVENGIIEVKYIDADRVKTWVESYPDAVSERYRSSLVGSIRQFCENYEANFAQVFSKEFYHDIDAIVDEAIIKAEFENARTPDIPSEYFNKTLAAAIATIDDEKAPVYYRALSCMLMMESQVGLRAGELFNLKVGCVKSITLSTGDTAYYVEYKTWKRHHGTKHSSKEITYVNSHFKKAYDSIIELSKEKRKYLKSDCLFVESKYGKAMNFPVTPSGVSSHWNNLFEYYNSYFQTIYSTPQNDANLTCIKLPKSMMQPERYLLRPTTTQFRVHVCTELYSKGCPVEYIEKFMSHLSAEMTYYYVRPKNTVQENLEESTRVLREMVTKEAIPIGAEKGLIDKIDQFIAENNFSIEKDLDAICARLAEEIPIRIKTGGVCIKSSRFRECSKDAKTDDFYCAYNVCPNIYTFYYMADISYAQVKDLVEAININREKGCIKQVQKNVNMVHSIVRNKLEPQVAELKRVINEKGLNYVLEKHPQLIDIIANLDDVQKEISEWKLMTV